MKGFLLGMLAAAVLGGLGLLIYQLRAKKPDQPPASASTSTSTPTPAAPKPSDRGGITTSGTDLNPPVSSGRPILAPGEAPPPGDPVESAPSGPSMEAPELTEEMIGQLNTSRAAIRAAARPCWTERTPPPAPSPAPESNVVVGDETIRKMTLSYTLVVATGSGSIADLKMLESDLTDKTLESCIVQRIGAARWPISGLDMRVPMRDELTVGELDDP